MSCAKSQCSYSHLYHLVGSLTRHQRLLECWVFICMARNFTVYLDDSGHPDDQVAVTVAGWVSTLEQWLLLESRWVEVLKQFGINSCVFHRSDFQAGQGEYSSLNRANKTRLLYQLLNLITTRVRQGFAAIVPMADYRRVNEDYYLEEALGKPYALAGSVVAASVESWKRRYAKEEDVIIIFEDGSKHKGDLEDGFIQYGFDRPAFRGKNKVVALQAADLFAWECFHSYKFDKITRSLATLLSLPVEQYLIVEDYLRPACEAVKRLPKRDPSNPLRIYFSRIPKRLRKRQIFRLPSDQQVRPIPKIFSGGHSHASADDF
jgi:hypothetical protein